MIQSKANHFAFYRLSPVDCIYLVIHVDDIVITDSDHVDIA